jgi:hypothetical protein
MSSPPVNRISQEFRSFDGRNDANDLGTTWTDWRVRLTNEQMSGKMNSPLTEIANLEREQNFSCSLFKFRTKCFLPGLQVQTILGTESYLCQHPTLIL